MYRFPQPPASYSPGEARAMIQQALAAAAELRRDTDQLPRVDADGSSECPFSERLYFDKEKTAQFVRDDLGTLRYFLKVCTGIMAGQQAEIHKLAHKRESLNGETAQDYFAKAELGYRDRLQIHQQIRRDLIDTIAEVEATLREAGTKQYPGGEPRGPFGERLYTNPHVPKPIEKFKNNSTKDAIERLRRKTKDL